MTCPCITVYHSLLRLGNTGAERSQFQVSEEHLQFPHLFLRVPPMIRTTFCFIQNSKHTHLFLAAIPQQAQAGAGVYTSDCLTVLTHSHTGELSLKWQWEKQLCPVFFIGLPDSMSICPALPQTFLSLLLYQATRLLHLDHHYRIWVCYFISYHVEKLEKSSIYSTPSMWFSFTPFRSHSISDPSSEPSAPARFSAVTSLSLSSSTLCAMLSETMATQPHQPVPALLGIPADQWSNP